MRLTERRKDGFYELKSGQEVYGEENGIRLVQIVGKYEDIEEEHGIDSATLFKAIKGIEHRCVYDVEEKCEVFVNTIIYYENDLIIKGYAENSIFLVKEYGKTWVLTKEELE